jgi:hypothetical protein
MFSLPLETGGSCLIFSYLSLDSTLKECILEAFKCEAEIYFKISVPVSQETDCLSATRKAGNCCLRKESLLTVMIIRIVGGEMLSI